MIEWGGVGGVSDLNQKLDELSRRFENVLSHDATVRNSRNVLNEKRFKRRQSTAPEHGARARRQSTPPEPGARAHPPPPPPPPPPPRLLRRSFAAFFCGVLLRRSLTAMARDPTTLWRFPGEPASFSGAGNVARRLSRKRGDPKTDFRGVRRELERSVLFQAHRDLRENFTRRADAVAGYSVKWEADLADVAGRLEPLRASTASIAEQSAGDRFFLVAVDCFSRKMFARGLSNKSGSETAKNMGDIFAELAPPYRPPETLETDGGKEFFNKHMASLCKKHGVRQKLASGKHKARLAERAVRSLKRILTAIYQTGSWKPEWDWNLVVSKAVKSANGRYNRAIGIEPDRAGERFATLLDAAWKAKRLESGKVFLKNERALHEGKPFKDGGRDYRVGDLVLAPTKSASMKAKESEMRFSLIPRRIEHIFHARKPAMYALRNVSTGKKAGRLYYARELKQIRLPSSIEPSAIEAARVEQGEGLQYRLKKRGWTTVKLAPRT